jgi:hypothetical protein
MRERKKYRRLSPVDRLLKHRIINEKTGCWIWNGRIDNDGYGRIGITTNGKIKTTSVHRYSFSIYNNIELTSFDTICHQCHNRKCFNPAHLKKSTTLNNSFEQLRDWNEFKDKHNEIVNEFMLINEKIKKAYLDWHRKIN